MPYKTRFGKATWEGTLKEGKGHLELQSGAYSGPYNFDSRFGDGTATNPEELIGAAHAGCYSMFLSSLLTANNTPPTKLETKSSVKLEFGGDGGPIISSIALTVSATVPNINNDKFQELAKEAKMKCPVSKSLAAVAEMTLDAKLN